MAMGGEAQAQTRVKLCELCGSEADVHCAADSAFLCRSCDAKIHSSNFLVARHLRRILCPNCKSLTGNFVSGSVSPESLREIPCSKSCSSISHPSSTSSFSSCCSSLDSVSSSELSSTAAGENTTEDKKPIRRRARRREGRVRVRDRGEAHGIFVNWGEELGLKGKSRDGVVSSASWAMGVLMEKPMVPYRVSVAASFWFGMRVSREAMTWQNLRRLQDLSAVPGKMIMAVEMRLSRALRLTRQWRVDLQEGWAESEGA